MDNRPYKISRPDGVTKFVIEHADHTYLIFDRKTNEVRCTKLNKKIETTTAGLVHNRIDFCHRCDRCCCTSAKQKERRYGRKGLTEYGRVLWAISQGKEVYAQLDLYKISYEAGFAEVSFVHDQQFCISEKGCSKYVYDGVWINGEWRYEWLKRKNFRLTQSQSTQNSYSLPKFHKTLLYDDIAGLNVGPLKYADTRSLGWLVKMNPYSFIELLYQWAKYPSIELLYKAGFEHIVKSRAEGDKSHKINWRGKSLGKILKSTPAEVKKIRDAALTVREVGVYKEAKELFPSVSPSFVPRLMEYGAISALKRITKELPAKKVIKYLQENDLHIRSYEDHLEMIAKTGSKRNSGNLYHENFREKHMALTELYKSNEKQFVDAGIKKAADKLAELEYCAESLQITAAKSSEELGEESSRLHHCVKTYADKIAAGRSYIFFIREKAAPDKPYYTLELNPKFEFVQCRGKHNCTMTPEVSTFVQQWEKFIKQVKKGVA